jgi:transcriptional regulator
MYLPAHFSEPRLDVLHEAIRASGLATLVTAGPGGLDASHLPFLLDPTPGPLGRLIGHLARANPQWQEPAGSQEALAIFLGPDAYVTPSWYVTKRETGKVVPTWNYLAIHAHGRLVFIHDQHRLLEIVTRLTDRHEATRPSPWRVSDAPTDYVETMLKGIVGIELTITRLEGKWKASQNRSEPDRDGVAEGLEREGMAGLASLVRRST